MRYTVPSGPSGTSAAQNIAQAKGGPGLCVIIANTGAVPVWISDSQQQLDGSLDATNTPQSGFILQPLSQPESIKVIPVVTTGLWARSNAPGGQVECIAWPNC